MSADALLRRREAFPFVINYYSWHKHSILLLHLKKKKKNGLVKFGIELRYDLWNSSFRELHIEV